MLSKLANYYYYYYYYYCTLCCVCNWPYSC
jgi:hypothetical protein